LKDRVNTLFVKVYIKAKKNVVQQQDKLFLQSKEVRQKLFTKQRTFKQPTTRLRNIESLAAYFTAKQ
jgi:hypothetical protein